MRFGVFLGGFFGIWEKILKEKERLGHTTETGSVQFKFISQNDHFLSQLKSKIVTIGKLYFPEKCTPIIRTSLIEHLIKE